MRVIAATLIAFLGSSLAFVPQDPALNRLQHLQRVCVVFKARAALELSPLRDVAPSESHEFPTVALPVPLISFLTASAILLATLPPFVADATDVPVPPTAPAEQVVAKGQHALTSAKSALDAAAQKYVAASNVLRDAQLQDDKAASLVAAGEKKVTALKKMMITENDKLSKAMSKESKPQIKIASEKVANARAAMESAQAEVKALRTTRTATQKTLKNAQSAVSAANSSLKQSKAAVKSAEDSIAKQKAKMISDEKAKLKAKKKADERARTEKKKLAKQKQEREKKLKEQESMKQKIVSEQKKRDLRAKQEFEKKVRQQEKLKVKAKKEALARERKAEQKAAKKQQEKEKKQKEREREAKKKVLKRQAEAAKKAREIKR